MDELYHVWFSIKGRKPALEGEVGDRVKRLFTETAMRVGIRLLEAELVSDHAHLLVAVQPT
jgi:REP element-mobilizing transposase RayT